MISMASADQARVASLKHAARRDLFVSRIEKYEAKVRQEQKAKAMLHKKRASVVQQQPPASALQLQELADKTIVPAAQCHSQSETQSKLSREQGSEDFSEQKMQTNMFTQRDKEDSSEHEMAIEPHEHSLQLDPCVADFQGAKFSGLKAVIESTEDLKISNLTPAAKWVSADEDRHSNCYEDVNVRPAVIEIDIAAIAAALKIRVKAVDMAALMQEHAFRCARGSLDSLSKVHCKVVAHALKKEFDKVYGPAWHCIVGTSFGSYVTHSLGGFVYFSMDKVSVLLFKTAVEPIDC